MKLRFGIISSLLLISNLSFAMIKFDQDQLTRFEETNKCNSCDLSSADIQPNHSNADLNNANLSNITPHQGFFNFSQGALINANLTGAFLMNSNFSNADLTDAKFNGAYVYGSNFFGAKGLDLSGAVAVCNVIMPDGCMVYCTVKHSQ